MKIAGASTAKEAYRRLYEVNDRLNCVVTAVEPAKEGIPIALKDNISTKGILTTACCRLLGDYIPVYDAHIVDKLDKAGFVCVAKANMDELSMGGTNFSSASGPCLNAYDPKRISGGSSGGSAVFVASGVVPVAIGTDTGDSIRRPASFNGVIGVKPTYGRISRYGVIPYASSLDHVGYFTTNVKDAAYMLEVLAGRDDRDMTSSFAEVPSYSKLLDSDVRGKKILVLKNVTDAIENKELLRLFWNIIDDLKKRGAQVSEVTFDDRLMRAIFPVYYVIANAEAASNHADLNGISYGKRIDGADHRDLMMKTRTAGFGPWIKKRLIIGSYALFEENQERIFRRAQKIRRLIVDEVISKLKDADALIAPTVPYIAPRIDEIDVNEVADEHLPADNHLIIANFAGLPSMSLPMGFVDGMPVGISVTANVFAEQQMFDIAKAIEEYTGLEDLTVEDRL